MPLRGLSCSSPCHPSPPASRPRRAPSRLLCCSSRECGGGGDRARGDEPTRTAPSISFVERYPGGRAKRYILDEYSPLRILREDHQSLISVPQNEKRYTDLSWIVGFLKDFILPAGYPGSVSDDYLDYMLWQFPTNVTGWICHTLVTSSLLKAVGIDSFAGSSAAASTAAIRWVSKDGLGAVGRLIIGGRFGDLFDDDPKQWRLYADFIGSAGSIFELCTPLYPTYFLPLASLGTLAKAIARGLKDPSFRVIQNHFAISANLGEVAAKEEVWEVTAQLTGLAVGILIMDAPVFQTSYPMLVSTWFTVRLLHLWLRYLSLSVLRFRSINLKRARILARSHVSHNTVLGYADCNKQEDILSLELQKPHITFGVSVEDMIGSENFSLMVKALLKLFKKEKYILFVKRYESRELEFLVTFKVGATNLSVMRSLWQVYWLHKHQEGMSTDVFGRLEESLIRLEDEFNGFLNALEEAGWDTHQISLKVQLTKPSRKDRGENG